MLVAINFCDVLTNIKRLYGKQKLICACKVITGYKADQKAISCQLRFLENFLKILRFDILCGSVVRSVGGWKCIVC